jgi:glutamyl-tRNA reductase
VKNYTLCTNNPSLVNLPGCKPVDRSELGKWVNFDLVICAAGRADRYLLSGEKPANQVIFDLCVPRIVDPRIATYNIEEIDSWINRKRADLGDQIARVKDELWHLTLAQARSYRMKLETKQLLYQ